MKFDAVFLSPHLDDAIWSCGGLIAKLTSENKQVLIVTFFTQARDKPISRDGIRFVNLCGFSVPSTLFSARQQEDITSCKLLKSHFQHLGYCDALFRHQPSRFSTIIPQHSLSYPSLPRVFSGKLSVFDNKVLLNQLVSSIHTVLEVNGKNSTSLYSPLGIGNHVDHLLLYKAATAIHRRITYWADAPYSASRVHVQQRLKYLNYTFKVCTNRLSDHHKYMKFVACQMYESQIKLLSKGDKHQLLEDERYYLQ